MKPALPATAQPTAELRFEIPSRLNFDNVLTWGK